MASGVSTTVLLVLAVSAWPPPTLTAWLLENAGTLDSAARVTRQVELTATAVHVLWLAVGQPIVPALLALTVLMGVECVLLGFTLNLVTLGRTGQR